MQTINAATRPLSAADLVAVFSAVTISKIDDWSTLVWICVGCGSTCQAPTVEDRDKYVDHGYGPAMVCCSPEQTITFHTVPDAA